MPSQITNVFISQDAYEQMLKSSFSLIFASRHGVRLKPSDNFTVFKNNVSCLLQTICNCLMHFLYFFVGRPYTFNRHFNSAITNLSSMQCCYIAINKQVMI